MGASWLFVFAKLHQSVQLQLVNFIWCKYLSKLFQNRSKQKVARRSKWKIKMGWRSDWKVNTCTQVCIVCAKLSCFSFLKLIIYTTYKMPECTKIFCIILSFWILALFFLKHILPSINISMLTWIQNCIFLTKKIITWHKVFKQQYFGRIFWCW